MVDKDDYRSMIDRNETVTIASSETDSTAIDCGGMVFTGFILPATFTGTAVTFKVSDDNSTFYALKGSDGNDISYTVAQGNAYAVENAVLFAGWRWIKIISGSSEGAERTIKVSLRGMQ